MDLLGGYGSDDDGDKSVNSTDSESAQDKKIEAKITSDDQEKISTMTTKSIGKKKKGRNKGRRMLSLGAVLPPEIFDRLTRSMDGDSSSSSDDDDDDDNGGQKKEGRKRQQQQQGRNHHPRVNGSSDVGDGSGVMNDLLRDLRSAPILAVTSSNDNNNKGGEKVLSSFSDDSAMKHKEEGGMGFAFMNSSVSTTTSRKNGSEEKDDVIDVHAKSANINIKDAATDNDVSIPLQSSSSSARIPRPGSLPRPNINSAPNSHPSLQYPTQSHPPQPQHHSTPSTLPTKSPPSPQPSKKRTRRQMDQMLRSGNFQSIEPTMTIDAPPPISTSSTTYHQPSSKGNNNHTIKATTLKIYDARSGTDMDVDVHDNRRSHNVTNSLKYRSKHQIHELMNHARVLEAKNRRNVGGGDNGRMDAKKKYGW